MCHHGLIHCCQKKKINWHWSSQRDTAVTLSVSSVFVFHRHSAYLVMIMYVHFHKLQNERTPHPWTVLHCTSHLELQHYYYSELKKKLSSSFLTTTFFYFKSKSQEEKFQVVCLSDNHRNLTASFRILGTKWDTFSSKKVDKCFNVWHFCYYTYWKNTSTRGINK